jgi:mRNA-degrading endonuclease RelE of RelBE toxin-antitoxin system
MKDRHKGRRDRIKEFLEETNTNCKLGGKELTERKKEKLWKGKTADYMTGLVSFY